MQIFPWLTCAGPLGAFLAVPPRRRYIDEEGLTALRLKWPVAPGEGTKRGEAPVVLVFAIVAAATSLAS